MKKEIRIEPLILPLVNAINETGIFRTFSSCQGHFTPEEQTEQNRNFADVRFDLVKGKRLAEAESFLYDLLNNYKNGLIRAVISSYKLYIPSKSKKSFVFVIKIHPFSCLDSPSKKRRETDQGIKRATRIVKQLTKKLKLAHR